MYLYYLHMYLYYLHMYLYYLHMYVHRVHVKLLVAGRVIRKELEAEPGLVWRYAWDRRNVYNQKVKI